MKKQNMIHLQWIPVVVFVLAAGCFYGCGQNEDQAVRLSGGSRTEGLVSLLPGGDGIQAREAPEGVAGQAAGIRETPEGGAGQAAGTREAPEGGAGQVAGTREAPEGAGGQTAGTREAPEGGAGQAAGTRETPGGADGIEGGGQTWVEAAAVCYVHVCGEVVNPGVYQLREGQRIYEAVEAAGGFTSRASRTWLNLAEKVQDGMKLEVPDVETATELASSPEVRGAAGKDTAAGSSPGMKDGRININTATREELMRLSGIGEARAEDIISYRQEKGYFQTIEDIMKVPGIKNAAFQKIKDDIVV